MAKVATGWASNDRLEAIFGSRRDHHAGRRLSTLTAVHSVDAAPLEKPLLRGWTHVVSFPVMLVAGVSMILLANATLTGRLLLGVYVGGTATMFCVSAIYHRGRWTPRVRARMQKLDRSAIFLAIGGGYTPIAFVCLDGWLRISVLAADVNVNKADRLANTIAPRRAKLLRDHAGDLFN